MGGAASSMLRLSLDLWLWLSLLMNWLIILTLR